MSSRERLVISRSAGAPGHTSTTASTRRFRSETTVANQEVEETEMASIRKESQIIDVLPHTLRDILDEVMDRGAAVMTRTLDAGAQP
jgi:hypothetical protein